MVSQDFRENFLFMTRSIALSLLKKCDVTGAPPHKAMEFHSDRVISSSNFSSRPRTIPHLRLYLDRRNHFALLWLQVHVPLAKNESVQEIIKLDKHSALGS